MANVLVQDSSLRSIAEAIRSKNGLSAGYKPALMAPAITALNTKPGLKQPHAFDLDTGYVMSGEWNIGGGTVNYSDVYRVSARMTYLLSLGPVVGSRFRVMFSEEVTSQATSNIIGVSIINTSGPVPYAYKTYVPEVDGYITVTKDNAGQAGILSYLVCVQDMVDAIS